MRTGSSFSFPAAPAQVKGLRAAFPAALLLMALALSASGASGQSIYGRVLAQGDTAGLSGVDLSLMDSGGALVARLQSDSLGFFRLPTPGPGVFEIRASRIGLTPFQARVSVAAAEAVEVELRVAEEAIPLEPIVVVARREIVHGTLDQFYDRMARNKQAGKGQFLTIDEIENRTQMSLTMLLQTMPGVWSQSPSARGSVQLLNPSSRGTFCTPEYFLDGRPLLGGFIDITLHDMEGVEVYRGRAESVEGEFPNDCGQIFLWRKRDWGNPFSRGRLGVVAVIGAILVAISTLI